MSQGRDAVAGVEPKVPLPADWNLPEGWTVATPEDVAAPVKHALAIGPFGSDLKVSDYKDAGVPLVFVRNIRSGRFDGPLTKYVSHEKAEKLSAHLVHRGDVLITKMGDPPGDATVYPLTSAAVITADCIKITPGPDTDSRYLSWVINSGLVRRQVLRITKGVAQRKVSLRRFRREVAFPLPPLEEQKQIVAAIEEQFSRLDVGLASVTRALRNLSRLRTAVLLSAVQGVLAEANDLDEPAPAALEREGIEPLPQDGLPRLPSKWAWVTLGSVLTSLRNGVFVSRPAAAGPGVAILRISALRPMALDLEEVRYAPLSVAEKAAHYFLEEGDLLFTRYSGNAAYVGACARVVGLSRPTLHPDKLIRAVVRDSVAFPPFIEIAVSVGYSRAAIRRRVKTTAGQTGIAGSDLKTVPIPLPPLGEQRRIEREAARWLSILDASGLIANAQARRGARLRESILAVAFSGRWPLQAADSEEPA